MKKTLLTLLAGTFISTSAFAVDYDAINAKYGKHSPFHGDKFVGCDVHFNKNGLHSCDHAWLEAFYPEKTSGVTDGFAWIKINGKYYDVAIKKLAEFNTKEDRIDYFKSVVGEEVKADFAPINNAVDSVMDLMDSGIELPEAIKIVEKIVEVPGDVDLSDYVTKAMAAAEYERGLTEGKLAGFINGEASVDATLSIDDRLVTATLTNGKTVSLFDLEKHKLINDLESAEEIIRDYDDARTAVKTLANRAGIEIPGAITDLTGGTAKTLAQTAFAAGFVAGEGSVEPTTITETIVVESESNDDVVNGYLDDTQAVVDGFGTNVVSQPAFISAVGDVGTDKTFGLALSSYNVGFTAGVASVDPTIITLPEGADTTPFFDALVVAIEEDGETGLAAIQTALDASRDNRTLTGTSSLVGGNGVSTFTLSNFDGSSNYRAAIGGIAANEIPSLTAAIDSAIEDAYNSGYDEGYADGYADGYVNGFSDGVASVSTD